MNRRVAFLAFAFLAVASGLFFVRQADAQVEEFSAYSASSGLAEVHADVFRLYWAFFDREPDLNGAQYWVEVYDTCATLLDITWSFSNSVEFKNRYGNLSNEQYVNLVYANVLNRSPDDEGKAYWLRLLDSGELIQAEVMLYFSAGAEFKRLHPLPSDGRAYGGCSVPASVAPTSTPTTPMTAVAPATTATTTVYYRNCSEARAHGAAPVRRGDPGYGSHLDRDDDGIGCE